MADDIFRKLSRGITFNRTRFRDDAEQLGIVEKSEKSGEEDKEVNAKDNIFITRTDDSSDEPITLDDYITPEFVDITGKGRIAENIANLLNWSKPTRVQMASMRLLLDGANLIATAQTGSGKTGAFMIPLVMRQMKHRAKKAIVLAPSRELAEQIGAVGRAVARGTGVVVSDTSQADKSIISGSIICATPNKIIALLTESKLKLDACSIMVLDECDKMVELSGNKLNQDDAKFFVSQVKTIKAACADQLQMCLYSATMSGAVEKFGKTHFKAGFNIAIGKRGNSVSTNVTQKVVYCGDERGKLLALRQFIKDGFRPPAILFTETKDRCQRIMGELLYDGINAMSLCAAKTPQERHKVIQATRLGKVWLLITTDVAARGLDLPATSCVINYDCPATVTNYVHRVGRCGRYNRRGHALTLMSDQDRDRIRVLRGVMLQSGAELPKAVLNLAKANNLNHKKKIKTTRIEREELMTKVPKRELNASETKFRRRKMEEKAKKAKKMKVLDEGWQVADGNGSE